MKKLLTIFFIVTIALQLFPTGVFAVNGDKPLFASRVSEITEITVSSVKSQSTGFSIMTKVEILNRREENYSVTVSCIYYPKVWIKASFVNKALELSQTIWCADMSWKYTYPPGITEEIEGLSFDINQTGLTRLPDGNYTLHRAMPEGKQYRTRIIVNSDRMEIIYHSFYYNRTEEVSSENTNQTTEETSFLLISSLVAFCFAFILYRVITSHKRTMKRIIKSCTSRDF